jgi:hypothetical protein
MHEVLASGETWRHPDYPRESVLQTHEKLRESLQDRFEAMHGDFAMRNQTLDSIQRAQTENHFKRRRELDERRLATLRSRGRSERAMKSKVTFTRWGACGKATARAGAQVYHCPTGSRRGIFRIELPHEIKPVQLSIRL